jgi:glycosyltransferase involved in cell wall biosynthesis
MAQTEAGRAPDVSVVVPAHRAAATLPACLRSLTNQQCSVTYEVIVVDDGSDDGTSESALRFDVRVLRSSRQGPAAARNLGASRARGRILLFTDADCQPRFDWIEEMLKPLADPDVAAVKGAYRSFQKELVARFVQLDREQRYRRTRGYPYVDSLFTNAAAIRRPVFEDVGGFDTALKVHEDTDLSFRLRRRGHHIRFNPHAIVYHHHPTTLRRYLKVQMLRAFWRMEVHKNYPQEAVSDSHVPQTLKLQIALLCCGGVLLVAAAWSQAFLWGAVAAGVLFVGSTLPFAFRALDRSVDVALASPIIMVLRAGTHALGMALWAFNKLTRRMWRIASCVRRTG